MSITRKVLVGLLLCAGLFLSIAESDLEAAMSWEEYDATLKNRNPEKRLEVITRAIGHYTAGIALLDQKKYRAAEVRLIDAIKVEPRFKEAHRALSRLYYMTGDEKKSAKHMKRYNDLADVVYVIDERDYLNTNMGRLRQQYTPSRAVDRIMFYLLFGVGLCIAGYFLFMSEALTNIGMRVRGVSRSMTDKQTHEDSLIVNNFAGEEKEERPPFFLMLLILCAPFVLFFIVSIFFGARGGEIAAFTIVPGLLVDVILYKLFFTD